MKKAILISLILISTQSISYGTDPSPGFSSATFTPSTINVGQTSQFAANFYNNANADPIPIGAVSIQIQFDDVYYMNDGVTQPTGPGADLFSWTFDQMTGTWNGMNIVVINMQEGGFIYFNVVGTLSSNGNQVGTTINLDLAPQYDDPILTDDNKIANLVVDAALPIQLLAFSAEKQDLQSYLQWATATEINNEYFQVERSRDGENFDPIGQVAGAGNSSLRKDYNFIDAHPIQGVNYYRLRQVDVDGLYSFSPIRALKFDLREHVFIYPNPSKSYAIVETPDVLRGCTMEVFDIHGKKYVEIELNSDKQEVMMDNWPSGSYTVKIVKKETHYEDTRTLIKQQ